MISNCINGAIQMRQINSVASETFKNLFEVFKEKLGEVLQDRHINNHLCETDGADNSSCFALMQTIDQVLGLSGTTEEQRMIIKHGDEKLPESLKHIIKEISEKQMNEKSFHEFPQFKQSLERFYEEHSAELSTAPFFQTRAQINL